MNYTELLTIAMPVYERKEYFPEALDSAVNQTIKCKIIVVDNCSSHDFFKEICGEKGITYYKNETNIGLFPNWNRCFDLAETGFVMILGDDDILSPDYVESFLKALKQYPDLDIYFSDFVLNNLTTKETSPHRHTLPFGYMENGGKIIEYGIKYKLGFPMITSSIKRSIFTRFYTGFHASNDWLWVYSNADKLTFYGDPKKLYKYGAHESQDSKNHLSNCLLSSSYIYEEVLKEKVDNAESKKKASENSFWALFRLKTIAGKKAIRERVKGDTIYGNYLKKKLNQDRLIKTIFAMPTGLVYLIYKSLRKIGLSI
jgi:glycosyltransferase involved in cell wall biosynthesis